MQGGEMVVAARGDDVFGVAVFRCFKNTFNGLKFYVDDLVTDEVPQPSPPILNSLSSLPSSSTPQLSALF